MLSAHAPALRPAFLRTTRPPRTQVASYAFFMPDDANVIRRVLLPLLDLINHANNDTANAMVAREGGSFVVRAIKDVVAGEEVRTAGGGGRLERGGHLEKGGRPEKCGDGLTHVRTPRTRARLLSPHARAFFTLLRTFLFNLRTNRILPQVRFAYSNGNARNDHALQHYGFVNRDRAADPLLCCVDEPGGDLWNCPDPGAGLLARVEQLNEQGG